MAADGAPPPAPLPPPQRRRPPGPAAGATALAAGLVAALVGLGGPEEQVQGAAAAPPAAPAGGEGAGSPGSDPQAVALLRRADEASRELAWEGTQFVARWSARGGSSALVDVVHVPGRGSLVTPTSAPAASALVPEAAHRAPAAPLNLLQRHYALRHAGAGRCAGRTADVVEAWRRDDPAGRAAAAPAARFWLDRASGLVLRREVTDPAGRTVLASAFLDLQPSLDLQRVQAGQAGVAALPAPALGSRLDPADPRTLRAEGWPVPPALAGLELHEARAGGSGQDRLVHLAYTDGLLTVSVFAQQGRLDPEALEGWEARQVGGADVWAADTVPQRVAWTAGGTVLTVLADAPGGTLDEAVRALPHHDPGPLRGAASEVRERLARGLARVADWVQPTDA